MNPRYERDRKEEILKKSYLAKIPKKHIRDMEDGVQTMHIEVVYEEAVSELSRQQSKRDQLVSFYFTAIAAIVAFITGMGNTTDKIIVGMVFAVLAFIGFAFTLCVIRYRVYKEAYWLQCRVITQLHNLEPKYLDKEHIQKLYAHAMNKRYSSVVVEKGERTGNVSYFRSWARQVFSAETLMFEVILVCSCSAMALSGHYFRLGGLDVLGIITYALSAFFLVMFNMLYIRKLAKVYSYVTILHHAEYTKDTKEEADRYMTSKKAFNYAFSKAWMLHCYIDDELAEDSEEETE